jgi:hypothetical protein
MVSIIKVLDGVTATTTSSAVNIEGAKKVVLVAQRAAHTSGSTAWTGTVSVDGTNFIAYNKWIRNLANAIAEGVTRVTTLTQAANGVDFMTMDPDDGFKEIKITATETTDGTHSAWLYVEY